MKQEETLQDGGSVPLEIVKDLRQQEVEEGPELGQVVLQRRAGQQQLVVGGETLQLPHQPTVEVLDPVALVHNQVLPLVALKQRRKGKESMRINHMLDCHCNKCTGPLQAGRTLQRGSSVFAEGSVIQKKVTC